MRKYIISLFLTIFLAILGVALLWLINPLDSEAAQELILSEGIRSRAELIIVVGELADQGLIWDYLDLRNTMIILWLFGAAIVSLVAFIHLIVDRILIKKFYEQVNVITAIRRGIIVATGAMGALLLRLITTDLVILLAFIVVVVSVEVIISMLIYRPPEVISTYASEADELNNKSFVPPYKQLYINLVSGLKYIRNSVGGAFGRTKTVLSSNDANDDSAPHNQQIHDALGGSTSTTSPIQDQPNSQTINLDQMSDKFYITTTLPYVNADPHIGHTLEFIQADVIARFHRQEKGSDNVFFNIGTDEHGLKMYTKAQDSGQTPQEYVDHFAGRWQQFADQFKISYDSFYRTSDKSHHEAAQEFWRRSLANGDIYKKKYEGLYCVGHEAFITEKELVDGKCPEHQTEPIVHSEENYFFKLSKYKDVLLEYYEQNPEVVKPAHKLNELRNWIESMDDISISRLKENLPWGIEVPDDPAQVFYVWFDALTNYVNTIGFPEDEERLDAWWPGVQIFGPDNLRFQAAIWQGMLASVGLPFTRMFLCHGMVLAEDGTKMSKTIGNVVSPFDQAEKWGIEAVRYYMISGITTFGNSAYKEADLVASYNSHLADNFGNLLNRVIHLAGKREAEINNHDAVEADFVAQVSGFQDKVRSAYGEFQLQEAAFTINELATWGNKYIDEQQPWSKDLTDEQAGVILNNLSYLLQVVIDLYAPIIPDACERAAEALGEVEKIILFEKLELAAE